MKHLVYPMPLVLGLNLLLTSLSKDYDQCVQNYNMHSMWKSIPELHAMLKLAKKGKGKNKGKSKLAYDPMHTIPPSTKKEHPAKDEECHHCQKLGHWRRNYPLYLVDLKKNKANMSGTSGALDLYVGNGNRAAIEAIGSFDLILPSGMAKGLMIYFDSYMVMYVAHLEPRLEKVLTPTSVRIPQAHERYGYYVDAEEHKLEDHGEPTNYRVAFLDPKFDKWLEAMNVEMQSMKDNQVWNLVDLPPNYKIVGSKWLFKKKTDMDANKHTYKARLVAKGFTQTYGVNN
ncbi:zinc finger, CCHC-type containing protein [Tanacetum coccineum]